MFLQYFGIIYLSNNKKDSRKTNNCSYSKNNVDFNNKTEIKELEIRIQSLNNKSGNVGIKEYTTNILKLCDEFNNEFTDVYNKIMKALNKKYLLVIKKEMEKYKENDKKCKNYCNYFNTLTNNMLFEYYVIMLSYNKVVFMFEPFLKPESKHKFFNSDLVGRFIKKCYELKEECINTEKIDAAILNAGQKDKNKEVEELIEVKDKQMMVKMTIREIIKILQSKKEIKRMEPERFVCDFCIKGAYKLYIANYNET